MRAFSIRAVLSSLFAGFLAAVLVGLVWPWAEMPALWIVAAVCYLGVVLNDGQMVKCDACGKRVKLGYATCHHCGYARV